MSDVGELTYNGLVRMVPVRYPTGSSFDGFVGASKRVVPLDSLRCVAPGVDVLSRPRDASDGRREARRHSMRFGLFGAAPKGSSVR